MTSFFPQCRSRAALFMGMAALALALPGCKMLPGGSEEEAMRIAPVEQGNPNNAVPFVPPPLNPNAKAVPPVVEGAPTIYPGTGVFVNPKPLAAQPAAGPEEASLNFESLDVREVAKVMLGDYLRESYTVHPAVAGTVTFRTIRPIPRKDLLPTLEMLLRQNNAAIVKEEGVYKILPVAAVRGSVSPQIGGSTLPLPQGFSVVVVPLKFVGAREMAKLLEPFAADNTVRVDEIRNLVIIAGHQREMRHLLDTIDLFDVDWLAGYSVGLFPVKGADVKTLVADFEKIFGAAAASPLGGIVRTIPIERMNALLVVTTQPKYLEMARTWLERFDQVGAMSGGGTRFFVYYVKNGKAENLAQLIGDLFSSRRSTTAAPSLAPGARPAEIRTTQPGAVPGTTTPAPVPSAPASATFSLAGGTGTTASEVRVIADKDTNSLLILSTPADYEVIEGALRKLDVVPRQVLVEVLLAEVSLRDDLEFGIDWFIRGRNNGNVRGTSNFRGSLPGPTAGVPAGSPATFPASSVGNFLGLQLISTVSPMGDVRAVLRALGEDGRSKTLASPTLMALDNQKSQIKVGRRISVQTQSQTGSNNTSGTVNSFQYLETGVLLSVTPRINSSGQVTLEISQEVSDPDKSSVTAANPNPDVNSRSIQSTVVVASGQSIVMAGLIQENSSRSTTGIPLLSKIPILGAAFGSQKLTQDRTELVLVITPKIISDALQARDASEELRDKMPSLRDLMPSFELPVPKTNRPPPPPIR